MTAKIIFTLERNKDGFPPIAHELINATVISDNIFRIENAPFFASNISYHDIVKASTSEVAGQYQFVSLVEGSTFTSISIIILDIAMDVFLMDLLRGLDCVIEYGEFGNYRILAVAVPASSNYKSLRERLVILEAQSKLSFAELAIANG